ncbi:hypothetical protein C0J52_12438 [Blattella germanica]|nr:hypothetical protein C0J52_12438 [Blattella germanica]
MAKSLRSKRKRMLRAKKRERYAKKELAQLKKVLGICDGDVEMSNISNIATVTDAKRINKTSGDVEMDLTKSQEYSKKTLRNKDGNYPVWLSSRERKRRVGANRIKKREQKRRTANAERRKGRKIIVVDDNADNVVDDNVDNVADDNVDNVADDNVDNVADDNVDNVADDNVDNVADDNVDDVMVVE